MSSFLNDIYHNGTDTTYSVNDLENLKHLIYWITLQEEINFPRCEGFASINLPFCRYFEAIYATLKTNNLSIKTIQNRCNNHGKNKPTLYNIYDAPNFYHY